jgi:hypothetical protein
MAVIEIAKIQVRRGQELQTGIPQLDPGEFGWAEDTEHLYIGKRIVEGANTDDNSRILTETDLNYFKIASQNTGTVNSAYQYRQTTLPHTVSYTVQGKLDDYVSLTDFGLVPGNTGTDITAILNNAVKDLYHDQTVTDSKRKLVIPAGTYVVSGTVSLPPYASLVGEGIDLTTLISVSTTTNMFNTVDGSFPTSQGWNNGMNTAGNESKYVSLQGMTVEYANTLTLTSSTVSLVSLDNVNNAVIKDVKFTIEGFSSIASNGTALSIRGARIGGIEQARNISIENCKFESIGLGVNSTGTVINTEIINNIFKNLNQGINISADSQLANFSPKNFLISRNDFYGITKEGIFVGTSSNRVNHIIENNVFNQVANGSYFNDNATTTATTAVITTYSDGCQLNDNYFSRDEFANTGTLINSTFYFNPLVLGNSTVNNNATTTATILGNTITILTNIAIVGKDQMINITYRMNDTHYSRKGTLILNIVGADNSGSVSDYYDYNYDNNFTGSDPTFYIDSSKVSQGYVMLVCDNTQYGNQLSFEYQKNILL